MGSGSKGKRRGYSFGTFQGVFTPSILTIIGVVMYLRFGWMLGHSGLAQSLIIVTLGSSITFLTGLSISALATNMRMKGGGAYFMLSRSLGPEAGAALGIPLALSQSIAVSFYITGFAEALVHSGIPAVAGWDVRIIGFTTLAVLSIISTLSADIALKTQYFIMAAIVASLVSFFFGSPPQNLAPAPGAAAPGSIGFWAVFAVFFPAVTGMLSGLGMSGDLKDPSVSIPRGTIAAVLVGYAIYMAIPIAMDHFVRDPAVLVSDSMVFEKCARWKTPVLLGVWAATLSSAIGSFLVAPRVVQALSRDRLLPAFLGRGFGKSDDPRLAAALCFAIAAAGVLAGDINILAPILTLFNLSTYALLDFAAGFEELMSNPSWRPSFRIRASLSFAGFALCVSTMFMISPGWTILALAVEAGIYFLTRKRRLSVRWGDMRSGILDSLARYALRSIRRYSGTVNIERNWRPNILVFTKLPVQNPDRLVLAGDFSAGKSFVTIASVLPPEAGREDLSRAAALEATVVRTASRLGIDAIAKLLFERDVWNGISEIVRTYGFGPLVPNTVMFGLPSDGSPEYLADAVKTAAAQRKNVIIAGTPGGDNAMPDGFVDIWWRGSNSNAGLMLALAYLVQRGERLKNRPLRLNMIVKRRTCDEAEYTMKSFLSAVRLKAGTRVVEETGERDFAETITMNSSDAAITFIGLRSPLDPEMQGKYGDYLAKLVKSLKPRLPVFVFAGENIDFGRIFS